MRCIERPLNCAIGPDPFSGADDTAIEHLRFDNPQSKNLGPRLRADFKLVFEPSRDDQNRGIALALQQRVGGDRRPHFDACDVSGWDCGVRCKAEEVPDALQRRIGVCAGPF